MTKKIRRQLAMIAAAALLTGSITPYTAMALEEASEAEPGALDDEIPVSEDAPGAAGDEAAETIEPDSSIEDGFIEEEDGESFAIEDDIEEAAAEETTEDESLYEEVYEAEVDGAAEVADTNDEDEYGIVFDNLDEVKEVPDKLIDDYGDYVVGAAGDEVASATDTAYIPIGHRSEGYINYNTDAKQQSIGYGIYTATSSDGTQKKDQRKYLNETCWAFATTGAMEASYNKNQSPEISNCVSDNKGIKAPFMGAIDLSERALTYFTYFNDNKTIKDPMKTLEKDSNYLYIGSHDINTATKATVAQAFALGGSPSYAMETLAMGVGLTDESKAPYSSEGSEEAATRNYNAVDKAYKFASDYELKTGLVIDMAQKDVVKEMVLKYGSVSTSIYYASKYMVSGNSVNGNGTSVYFHHPSTAQNHNILIVGWDDEMDPALFKNDTHKTGAEEKGAWLCKNSYGNEESYKTARTGINWAYEYGYFWVSYDTTDKLLASNGVRRGFIFDMDAVEKKNVSENRTYQYDGSAFSKEITAGSSYANIYNVNPIPDGSYEYLRSVLVKFATPGSVYSVQLYADPALPDPTTGTPLLEGPIWGKVDAAGYHTVDLGQGVELKAEKNFAVVVNLYKADISDDTPGIYSGVSGKYTMSVATNSTIDSSYDPFGATTTTPAMYYCLNSTNKEHSMLYNTSTREWEDLYQNADKKNIHGNLRIKLKTVVKSETEELAGQVYDEIEHFVRKSKDVGTKEQPIVTLTIGESESGTTVLYVGQTAIIKVDSASGASFTSKKPKVAEVDSKGLVTAIKKGVALITVNAGGVEIKHRIMVRNPSLVTTRCRLSLTNSMSLAVNGPYQSMLWESTKPDIVAVDEKGKISAVGSGSAQVRVVAGSTKLKCKVIVPKLEFRQRAITLAPETPEWSLGFKDKSIDKSQAVFASADTAVVKVDEKTGAVTAVGSGKTFITATVGGAQAKCNVVVMGY